MKALIPSTTEVSGSTDEIVPSFAEEATTPAESLVSLFKDSFLTRSVRRKTRSWVLPFGPIIVPPLYSITIQERPGILFRGEDLINTGDTEGLFLVGLFVRQTSQIPTFQNPIPVSQCQRRPLDSGTSLDTCAPDDVITLQIQNASSAPKTFSMNLVGRTVL